MREKVYTNFLDMESEKFCLRWNDFESNIACAFKELKNDEDFYDVTIVCDDEQFKAHKMIVSACSEFFRKILKRNPHPHPLLYLKGVGRRNLHSVLEFMYNGEVSVVQEELNAFLAVAEDLKVKGLTQHSTENTKNKIKVQGLVNENAEKRTHKNDSQAKTVPTTLPARKASEVTTTVKIEPTEQRTPLPLALPESRQEPEIYMEEVEQYDEYEGFEEFHEQSSDNHHQDDQNSGT